MCQNGCFAVCLVSTKAYLVPIANPANLAYSAQQLAALYASAIPGAGGGGAGGAGAAGNPQQIPGALSAAAAASMQQAPGVFGREGRIKERYSLQCCMFVVANHELKN